MRKKKHPEHVNHERWLVSYADFITLLFAFFTTLYAISTVDQKKAGKLMYSMRTAFDMQFFPSDTGSSGAAAAPTAPISSISLLVTDSPIAEGGAEEEKQFKKTVNALMVLAERADLKDVIKVHQDDRGVVVSLSQAHFFASAVADLSKAGLEPLDRVIGIVGDSKLGLIIEGHTDNVPIKSTKFKSNWELSTARATTVVAYFVDRHDIQPERITAAGYAEYRPAGDNTTEEGRKRNRRIDLVVVAPHRKLSPNDSADTLPGGGSIAAGQGETVASPAAPASASPSGN